jgi:hypothetical protein
LLPFSNWVYILPSFFFLCMRVNAHTFFINQFFVRSDDIRWETREKNCVCVHYSKIRDEDRHKERNG